MWPGVQGAAQMGRYRACFSRPGAGAATQHRMQDARPDALQLTCKSESVAIK
jgi:hypothetical protein